MVRPLGLTAYLALNGAGNRPVAPAAQPRPSGTLVLAFDTGGGHRSAFRTIGTRLADERGDLSLLVCGAGGDIDLPAENSAAITAFLDHWKPDAVLWADGPLRPALIHLMAETDLPMTLINLSQATVETRPSKVALGLRKTMFRAFDTILCSDQATRDGVVRLGASAARVTVSGHLSNSPVAAGYDTETLDDLRAQTANRPMWLCIDTPMAMSHTLEATHRDLSRVSHRLIMLVLAQSPAEAAAMHSEFQAHGWDALELSPDIKITADTQIIVAGQPSDLGVLLRLCPLAVMASTFDAGDVHLSPMDAALLGAAIVHGPNLGAMRPDFGPLMAGGATRPIAKATELPSAVSDLLAADKSAALAHKAWDISTRGAPVMDTVLEVLNQQLDTAEAT